MKKLKTLLSTMLCLCTMCALALPAHALEYNINAPDNPEYGKPTSFEPVVTADGGAMKNEDVSKNAALIPPGFGTPSSYMLNTGEYLTPNLVPSQMAGAGQVNGNVAVVTPPASGSTTTVPGTTGGYPITDTSTSPSTTPGFTEVTSDLYYSDGSLGTLKIPSIGLTVKVFEGTRTMWSPGRTARPCWSPCPAGAMRSPKPMCPPPGSWTPTTAKPSGSTARRTRTSWWILSIAPGPASGS